MSDEKDRLESESEIARLRKRIEELEERLERSNLSEASDQYRTLFERSADAILIIEGDTFVDCNQATVEMLRYSDRQQLLETHPSELSPPFQPDGRDSFEKANEIMAIAVKNGSHRFEWDHIRADGEVFPVEVLLTTVSEGETTRLHVVWRDITERKELEARLRHAQKMEAIGKLAGGVAHDFNNLLVAINGNAELLEEELAGNEDLLDLSRQIRWAGERAAELTRQLLAFSRKQVLLPAVLDLNLVLTEIKQMLARILGEDVELITRVSTQPVMLKVDPGQIEQILINLATNSRDAMPKGGTLTLEAETVQLDESSSIAGSKLPAGTYAQLTVSDTGVGMSPEVAASAFDPFFTTKELGRGTGLGLATVYGIVRQSGGNVILESSSGVGTTVRAWFPTTDEVASIRPTGLVPAVSGRETILVVEDESAVATLVGRILRRSGYDVILCHNGAEALDVYEARADQIDLVLSDVVMPRMGGPEMIRLLRERGYDPLVIFASGYTDETYGSVEQIGKHADFLNKPFNPTELLRKIRNSLDRAHEIEPI